MTGSNDATAPYFEHELLAVLSEAVERGGLETAILTTLDGLPLARVEKGSALDILAGLSSLFADIALRSERLLEWPDVEEVSLVSRNGIRLVTRKFVARGEGFILVVLVPANRTYRRVTNIAVSRLKGLLEPAE